MHRIGPAVSFIKRLTHCTFIHICSHRVNRVCALSTKHILTNTRHSLHPVSLCTLAEIVLSHNCVVPFEEKTWSSDMQAENPHPWFVPETMSASPPRPTCDGKCSCYTHEYPTACDATRIPKHVVVWAGRTTKKENFACLEKETACKGVTTLKLEQTSSIVMASQTFATETGRI